MVCIHRQKLFTYLCRNHKKANKFTERKWKNARFCKFHWDPFHNLQQP